MKAEFVEQANALRMMHGDSLDLIERHGQEFRSIIECFLSKFDRCPTADDLVWIASEHAGRDLRKPCETI